ncbi:hypothetical protein ACPV5U_19250 [Vibrio mediterranei]
MKELLPLALVLLVGCNGVEHVATETFCQQALNSKIDSNTTGFRPVSRTTVNGIDTIGYIDNSIIVPHSECSAATIETDKTFSWFEYGAAIEKDGVHSIRFYTNSLQQSATHTKRLPLEGRWQEQYVENGQVTRQIWLHEPQYTMVDVVRNYNGASITESRITSGKIEKTKRWNDNTATFDCSWNNDGLITNDIGCVNEVSLDLSIVGTVLDNDFYLDTLQSSIINYEQEIDNLYRDINRYW